MARLAGGTPKGKREWACGGGERDRISASNGKSASSRIDQSESTSQIEQSDPPVGTTSWNHQSDALGCEGFLGVLGCGWWLRFVELWPRGFESDPCYPRKNQTAIKRVKYDRSRQKSRVHCHLYCP